MKAELYSPDQVARIVVAVFESIKKSADAGGNDSPFLRGAATMACGCLIAFLGDLSQYDFTDLRFLERLSNGPTSTDPA